MDRISDEERRRIAELLAEGAPVWRLHREIDRSRFAIRRAVIALQRPARREPERSPLRLSLAVGILKARYFQTERCCGHARRGAGLSQV
jgi:transposase-like protein